MYILKIILLIKNIRNLLLKNLDLIKMERINALKNSTKSYAVLNIPIFYNFNKYYNVFTVLCKYHVSTLPSTSQGAFEFTSDLSDPNAMISFNLSCPSTLSFLSLLSSFRLPYISWYYFNCVPPDWESLNSYLISAMPNLSMFYFNVTHLVQIDSNVIDILNIN